MTEAEALDEAAKVVGCGDWGRAQDCCFNDELNAIRAHAKTLMENAALEAKLAVARGALEENAENARLLSMSAEREVNLRGELLRLQRKNAALKAERIRGGEMVNAALKAENERLFDVLFDAIALIGHVVPMNTTALVGGEKLTALNVWQAGHDLMFPKRQARAALKEIEGD